MKEPNHICKNCGKPYYHCDNCGKLHDYREMACSPECYMEYQDAIIAARAEEPESAPQEEIAIESAEAPSEMETTPVEVKAAPVAAAKPSKQARKGRVPNQQQSKK